MANRRKTRNFFPLPAFQFRFLALLLGGAIVQITLTCFILYFFLRQNYMLLVRYAALDDSITKLLDRELHFMSAAIATTFLAYLFGMTLIGIVFSHRIAGPMYAIRRTIRDINAGRDSTLRLRKTDEWQDIVAEFNTMLRVLKTNEPTKPEVVSGKDKKIVG